MQKEVIFRPDDDLLKIAAEMLRVSKRLYPSSKNVFLFCEKGTIYLAITLFGGFIQCRIAKIGPVEQPFYWIDRDSLLRAIDNPKAISTFSLEGTSIKIRRGDHTFHLHSSESEAVTTVKASTKILTMPAHLFALDVRLTLKSAAGEPIINGTNVTERVLRFEKHGGVFIMAWTNGESMSLLKETYPLDQDITMRYEPLLVFASLSALKKKQFVTASVSADGEVYFSCGPLTAISAPSTKAYYDIKRYLAPRTGTFNLTTHADAVIDVLEIIHGADTDCIVLKQTKGHPRIDLFVVNPDKLNTDNFLKTSFPLRGAADSDMTAIFSARLFYKAVAAFEGKKVTISSSSSDSSFLLEADGDLKILLMPKRNTDMVKLNNFIELYKK